MVRKFLAFVLVTGLFVLGFAPRPGGGLHGSVYAQGTTKRVEALEAYVAAAREGVETGAPLDHVQGNRHLAWGPIKQIRKRYHDDENAMEAAVKASEACVFEVPVAYFDKNLDATPCDAFITDVQGWFEGFRMFAQGWMFGDDTPKQQERSEVVLSCFRMALSERVNKTCPAQAEAQGY